MFIQNYIKRKSKKEQNINRFKQKLNDNYQIDGRTVGQTPKVSQCQDDKIVDVFMRYSKLHARVLIHPVAETETLRLIRPAMMRDDNTVLLSLSWSKENLERSMICLEGVKKCVCGVL